MDVWALDGSNGRQAASIVPPSLQETRDYLDVIVTLLVPSGTPQEISK